MEGRLPATRLLLSSRWWLFCQDAYYNLDTVEYTYLGVFFKRRLFDHNEKSSKKWRGMSRHKGRRGGCHIVTVTTDAEVSYRVFVGGGSIKTSSRSVALYLYRESRAILLYCRNKTDNRTERCVFRCRQQQQAVRLSRSQKYVRHSEETRTRTKLALVRVKLARSMYLTS